MLSPTRLARHMMDRASAALQLAHLGSPRDVTAEDEDAFARHTVDLTADYAVLGSGFMVMAIFIWWPIDLLVGPDDRYLEAFAAMRTRGLVLMGTTLALFLCSNRARRAARVVGPLAYAALMGCIGYSLGEMGSSELSWFGNAILGVVPASLIPLRLLPRIAVTLLIGLSLPASFFFVAPDAWGAPAGPGQLSFVLFAILVTIIVGEVLHRVLRRSFFEQRALDRARERLSELNGSLADRVTAQTNELRALASRLERTQETERLRISRDLHDELAQELTAMRYTIHQLEREHGRRPEAVGVDQVQLDVLAVIVGEDQWAVTLLALDAVERRVARDREQPALELVAALEPVDRVDRPDEGILSDILGFGPVAQHAREEIVDAVEVAFVEDGEGILVAVLDEPDQARVIEARIVTLTHCRRHPSTPARYHATLPAHTDCTPFPPGTAQTAARLRMRPAEPAFLTGFRFGTMEREQETPRQGVTT